MNKKGHMGPTLKIFNLESKGRRQKMDGIHSGRGEERNVFSFYFLKFSFSDSRISDRRNSSR